MRLSLTDEKFLGLVWQVLVVGIVAGLVVWLWTNALHNLNARRIATGFDFLSHGGMTCRNACGKMMREVLFQ